MSPQPSGLRIGAACIAAAAAAAAPTILYGLLAIFAFPVAFIIAGAHALFLGLPTYLLMRRRVAVDWQHALIAGFLIGMVPLTLLNWWSWGVGGSVSFVSLLAGLCGVLGGAAFRAVIGAPVDPRSTKQIAAVFE